MILNNMYINKWVHHRAGHKFRCSYWDCANWIDKGDEYYDEDTGNPDLDGQEPYCVNCTAFFAAQTSNMLLAHYNVKLESDIEL